MKPRSLFLLCFLCFTYTISHAQVYTAQHRDSLIQARKDNKVLIENRSLTLYDVRTVVKDDWDKLYRIPEHPAFDSLLTPQKESAILAEINRRRKELGKDTLLTSDCFYVWKPYFDWLHHEDPHYRIFQVPGIAKKDYKNHRQFNHAAGSRRLPVYFVCIGDSVVITRSFDPLFRKGDMVLSINGVGMDEYLNYTYRDRFTTPLHIMLSYNFIFAVDNFNVRLLRDGEEISVETNGYSVKELEKHTYQDEYNVQVFDDAKCGYIQIKKFFPHNGRVIKITHNTIKDFKKQGITNVIIDVRKNPGGSGDRFDKLMSIFIDKPTVKYLKGKKLKVSEQTLGDYDFLTKDMTGKLVEIPEKYLTTEFSTDPKMYVDGMKYYVLMSRDTGSMAASFVNILQYNGAATLAGEPLLRNALKYGEVIAGDDLLPTMLVPLSVSTTEIDEYTKAVDGVVMPDIHIPYVAADYMAGKDGVLEKLLEIIKSGR